MAEVFRGDEGWPSARDMHGMGVEVRASFGAAC